MKWRFCSVLLLALLLGACGYPEVAQTNQVIAPAPKRIEATPLRQGTIKPDAPRRAPDNPANDSSAGAGAHSYEGDSANSVTITAGNVLTIHNPDFSRGYTVKVVSISATGITLATDEPHVTIRDNGGAMPYLIHDTESYATGYELPIGWARFTPLEKTPVMQTYSMQPGGTIVRSEDDG